MKYYLRGQYPDVSIACAESQARADVLAAQGYVEVTQTEYLAWWGYLDAMRVWELRQQARAGRPRARVVGELI